MKENKSDWRQSVSISKLPKMLLLGMLLAISSFSFAQSNANANAPGARMRLTNDVTVRTGLHASYMISINHFRFLNQQDAVAYFQARDVNYITFVVLDKNTVQMNFELNNPAVANWTLDDWNQALTARATNSTARILPSTGN